MGSRDGQNALPLSSELIACPTQIFGLQQQTLDHGYDRLARSSQTLQSFAGPHKDLNPEFFLEFPDLAAYAGLRRVERLRHRRQVKVATNRFANVA
jgi:hypothetical protein